LIKMTGKPIQIAHANILLLCKSDTQNGYFYTLSLYEPHGSLFKMSALKNLIDNFVEVFLQYCVEEGILIRYHGRNFISCPEGIQSYTTGLDVGYCLAYSYFWYYCFLMCLHEITLYMDVDRSSLTYYVTYFLTYLERKIVKTFSPRELYLIVQNFINKITERFYVLLEERKLDVDIVPFFSRDIVFYPDRYRKKVKNDSCVDCMTNVVFQEEKMPTFTPSRKKWSL